MRDVKVNSQFAVVFVSTFLPLAGVSLLTGRSLVQDESTAAGHR